MLASSQRLPPLGAAATRLLERREQHSQLLQRRLLPGGCCHRMTRVTPLHALQLLRRRLYPTCHPCLCPYPCLGPCLP
jgi:hypothetical protein